MSRSSQIYKMVQSFSRGEKRQFKLQAFKYEKRGKHISAQLFDIFDSLKKWDENAFQNKLDNAGIKKDIAVHLNTLLSLLMESLRIKESGSNILFKINRLVEDSILLTIRDEFSLALSRIRRAKTLAKEAELSEKLPEILLQERQILQNMLPRKEYDDFRQKQYDEIKESMHILDNEVEYYNLVEDIFSSYFRIGYPETDSERSEYEQSIRNPKLEDISMALSSSAKSSFYFVHTLYYQSRNDYAKASEIIMKQAQIYEANKMFTKAHAHTYIPILNNLAIMQAQIADFKEFNETVQKMRAIPKQYSISDNFMEQRIFEYSYGVELDFYFSNDRISDMADIIPTVEEKIEMYCKNGRSFNRFLNLALHIALYYFRIGEIEKAHHWVKRILEHDETRSVIYIILYTILLDLVLHFQLGDYKYLQYRINSVQKFFKKHKQLIPVNELFFKTLKQLMKASDMNKAETIIGNFEREFQEIPNSLTSLFYKKYLGIDELIACKFWMEERLA